MMEETRTYSYKVAGLTFSVIAPVGIDIEALLPSFKDFREAEVFTDYEQLLFTKVVAVAER